jgi:uncharacterized protein
VIIPDINVLVYAAREDATDHDAFRHWLDDVLAGDQTVGVADAILSGFVRVVSHPRVFAQPTPTADALAFADALRGQPNAVGIAPGPRHWDIFRRLCLSSGAKGNLVPDAYLAALAIESGSEFATTDRDYARFDGLRWRHPLGD